MNRADLPENRAAGDRQRSRVVPETWRRPGYSLSETAPIRVGFVTAPWQMGPEYDMHYALEFGVVLSGTMRRHYRSWETDLAAGQVWYCGIFEPHGYEILEAPCDQMVLTVLPQALFEPGLPSGCRQDWLAPFSAPPDRRPQVAQDPRREIGSLVAHIFTKLTESDSAQSVWLRLFALELLAELQRDWAPPSPRPLAVSGVYEAVDAAVRMVLSGRVLTAKAAAEACGVSASTFSRAFARLLGVSFAGFCLRHRVCEAAGQLLRTNDPVKSVAAHFGFTDVSHLHRCFLRHYGCSPGVYRSRRGSPRSSHIPTPEMWSALWQGPRLPGLMRTRE